MRFLFSRAGYFNPRSREGSDRPAVTGSQHGAISIHAPAKGATFLSLVNVSTPFYFNPRSREGSDLFLEGDLFAERNISIHAPAKGATAGFVVSSPK